MRVALILPIFPQVSETFIASKVLGLVDRGMDVHVVCETSPAANWAAFGPEHRVHELRDRVQLAPQVQRTRSGLVGAARSARTLARTAPTVVTRHLRGTDALIPARIRDVVADAALVKLRPDVVHFEFGSLAPQRMRLGTQLDAAITVSFRGYDLNYVGLDDPHHYASVWGRADGIHVLGEDLWRRAVHRGAPEDLPHTLISPAIDASLVDPGSPRPGRLGSTDAPVRIVSIGRLHWKKGYEHGLDAVSALRGQGIHVEHRIIGSGELLGAVAFWRHQLGLDEVVELCGSLPPARVAEHLRWADVLLHPATSEGFCNAVIEAQAHAVPVVCSDADGLSENIEHGVTGFVTRRRQPLDLADAIEQLANDPELRARMGAAGRARVERRFRMDDHLDAWERFYRDALERRSTGRM